MHHFDFLIAKFSEWPKKRNSVEQFKKGEWIMKTTSGVLGVLLFLLAY